MDHNEDIDKEIRISLSIFWDIAIQGGNEGMRYLSNSFIYGPHTCKINSLDGLIHFFAIPLCEKLISWTCVFFFTLSCVTEAHYYYYYFSVSTFVLMEAH